MSHYTLTSDSSTLFLFSQHTYIELIAQWRSRSMFYIKVVQIKSKQIELKPKFEFIFEEEITNLLNKLRIR